MLRFGTDGVRGDAEHELTSSLIVALGRALGRVLGADEILIGRDPRESGERIERALASGIAAEGVSPVSLGVLPTPAIAYAAASSNHPAAIVSASHNPWRDNGVKVVGPDGRKLADELERAIESELQSLASDATEVAPVEVASRSVDDAYVAHLLSAIEGRNLDGLRVVLDCANGATSALAERVFGAAGAAVTVLHDTPNGRNINEGCGSTHPESLQASTLDLGADLGLAFDGDGDRVLAVDEHGELVDGDQIIAMHALDLHERDRLVNDAVAVTVMSNVGLRRALQAAGIELVETPVGDRHVVAAMRQAGLVLGGEQSGHIVFAQHATTGDGLLTGLLVADLVRRTGRPMSELAACMTRSPQVLLNVRVATRASLDDTDAPWADALWADVRAVERELGEWGKVLVRASGTEPLVRVMVEAATEQEAHAAATRLAATVASVLGTPAGP